MLKSNRLLCLFLTLFCASVFADRLRTYSLDAEQWSRPRHGKTIPQFQPLGMMIEDWEKVEGNQILIRYPGEDSGEIWAAELRDWLISLGIPGEFIQLVAGSRSATEMTLIVGQPQDFAP